MLLLKKNNFVHCSIKTIQFDNTKKMKHNHLSDNTKLETGSKSNSSFKNSIESQATVAKYHVFMKNIEKIKSNTNLSKEEKCKQIAHIEKNNKISLKKYQEASIFGSSTIENAGFNCGLWVKNEIHKRIFCKRSSNDKDNYYVLDVGAINNQYINKLGERQNTDQETKGINCNNQKTNHFV